MIQEIKPFSGLFPAARAMQIPDVKISGLEKVKHVKEKREDFVRDRDVTSGVLFQSNKVS